MVDDIIDVTEAAGVAGKETAVDMQVSVTLVIRAVGTYVCMCVYSLTSLSLDLRPRRFYLPVKSFPSFTRSLRGSSRSPVTSRRPRRCLFEAGALNVHATSPDPNATW